MRAPSICARCIPLQFRSAVSRRSCLNFTWDLGSGLYAMAAAAARYLSKRSPLLTALKSEGNKEAKVEYHSG